MTQDIIITLSLSTISYKPLNLYRQFKSAAQEFPNVTIYFDQPYASFAELGLENTYQTVFEAIQKRAAQFAEAGIVGYRDKVVLYKSPVFDTYLLAVAVTALGAVPVMISYHLPSSNLDVFAERLEKSFIVYDQETEERVAGVTRTDLVTKVFLPQVLVQETVAFEENLLPEDVIQYMTHTSGTTGVPKLICHTAQTMGWRVAWQQTIFDKMTERGLLAFHISPVHSRYNIGVSSAMWLGFSPSIRFLLQEKGRLLFIVQVLWKPILTTLSNGQDWPRKNQRSLVAFVITIRPLMLSILVRFAPSWRLLKSNIQSLCRFMVKVNVVQ